MSATGRIRLDRRGPQRSIFEGFVRTYGVEALAAKLDVRPSAIYHWLRAATAPRHTHAEIIQRIARDSGFNLTLDQIYAHAQQLRAEIARSNVGAISSPASVAAVV